MISSGTPYVNVVVQNWPELKPKMVFGQVPYLKHGDYELNQSMAILRYIARLTGTPSAQLNIELYFPRTIFYAIFTSNQTPMEVRLKKLASLI